MTRPTEVEMVLRNAGMERGTRRLLIELFERVAACEIACRDLAVIQLQLATQLEQVTNGAVAIRQQVEKMQRGHDRDDDDTLPPLAS